MVLMLLSLLSVTSLLTAQRISNIFVNVKRANQDVDFLTITQGINSLLISGTQGKTACINALLPDPAGNLIFDPAQRADVAVQLRLGAYLAKAGSNFGGINIDSFVLKPTTLATRSFISGIRLARTQLELKASRKNGASLTSLFPIDLYLNDSSLVPNYEVRECYGSPSLESMCLQMNYQFLPPILTSDPYKGACIRVPSGTCPAGQALSGFDLNGQMICTPRVVPTPTPTPTPTPSTCADTCTQFYADNCDAVAPAVPPRNGGPIRLSTCGPVSRLGTCQLSNCTIKVVRGKYCQWFVYIGPPGRLVRDWEFGTYCN